jgi:AcrR family transcriptional regulator
MGRATRERPLDRRQRRSRAALRSGLLELICEVPYDGITIDQIAERADVGRATFYAHYGDKADLLRELADELITEAANRARVLDPAAHPGSYSGSSASEIVKHAGEHPDLYRLVISGAGGPAPRAQLFNTLRDAVAEIYTLVAKRAGRKPRVAMHVTTTAFTGALLAIVEDWLAGPMAESPADVAARFMHGQVEGLRWALGMPADTLAFEAPKSRRRG